MMCYGTVEKDFFYQPVGLTWSEARNHCQVCFQDLVTLTPENIQIIVKKVKSHESWVGLRKSFNSTGNITIHGDNNSTGNITIHESNNSTGNITIHGDNNSTGNITIHGDNNSTSNSTSNSTIEMPWSRWANGDPLSFQNWYPGWPVLKSPSPKTHCCSCSCTCPQPTTQSMTTQRVTDITQSTNVQEARTENEENGSASVTKESVSQVSGPSGYTAANTTHFTAPEKVSTQSYRHTTTPPTQAECVRSLMQILDDPDVDENYIEDSCVAMLSFGAWVERDCSTPLPFVCYEERFSSKPNVTNVTSSSANLTWERGPGDITHYRVEVNGKNVSMESTNQTLDLTNLTAGSHQAVKVFAVKCGRELHPQDTDFYTTPNKVLNLKVASETETSISLNWTKPDGNVDFYVVKLEDKQIKNETVDAVDPVIKQLVPGNLHTITVLSGIKGKPELSEESEIDAYTKPGKVSNLTARNNTNTWLLLTWEKPEGNSTLYNVTAEDRGVDYSPKYLVSETQVNVTKLRAGSNITLSVRAVVNETLHGDKVTIHSYTAPEPVSDLTLKSGHNNITASWKPPDSIFLSFTVKLQLDGIVIKTKRNVTEPKEYFQGLESGAKYTVIVYAVSEHLESPPETRSKFTLPAPPVNLTVPDFGTDTITLRWDAPSDAAKSNFLVHISSSFWGYSPDEVEVNTTSYKFVGLKSGTNYALRVRTVADEEKSDSVYLRHSTRGDKTHTS
ncbi:receptor-type tyrosine-protein phosphatase eta [Halichoeres trimaculatus]|uniref:receptor-type tyrosine-protein phosphatase eta n=1 Tax=Halichoeres trimaculatus TaxID=147232 RepID=UPI003D9DEBD8